jgi:surface antigen
MLNRILIAAALVALAAPAAAQGLAGAQRNAELLLKECQDKGGRFQNGRCEIPNNNQQQQNQQGQGNNQRGDNQGGGRGNGPQGGPVNNQQGQNQQGQGNNQRGNNQGGGRGNGPQGGPGDNQQGQNQQGQGNDQRGDDQGRGRNGQFGGNNGRFGGGGQFGANNRNYNQRDFDRSYYGRYGNDPRNFADERRRYRAQQNWRENYYHDYVYADDPFYSDCRQDNTVGGAIIGGILGGLLGNAASRGNGGATIAGIILGGAVGANFGRDLDCEDRGYVYQTYYDGFERGRPRARYDWRNDRTGHYGTLEVGDYYRDRDGFRCATYSQTIYVRGRPQLARGHACRQGDGTWTIVD